MAHTELPALADLPVARRPLTAARRARKIARAQRTLAEATLLLVELYEGNREQTYRLSADAYDAHVAVGRAATAAEAAVAAAALLG